MAQRLTATSGVVRFCSSALGLQRLNNPPSQQRHHDLMVPCYFIALATELGGALHDVYAGAVVTLHVEIAGRKVGGFAVVQIACYGQRLQKYLGHYHGAAEVENDAPIVERWQRCGQTAEIAVTRVSYRCSVGRRMLVNYFGA